jgi:hypothetical protein
MAEKAGPDGTVRLRSEPATLTTFWANSKTAPKKDEGQKRQPQALITEESSGEDSANEAERKRRDKKGTKGEAVHPLPFLSLGRTVPGPGEEYGAEDYVLLPDVFGDMGGKKSKPSPKPSLPLPKEVAAQKGEKPDTGPSAVKLRGPDREAGGQGISRKRDKEKRWADQMEEDEAELAREKASLAEERERWRANRQEEEVLNLGPIIKGSNH